MDFIIKRFDSMSEMIGAYSDKKDSEYIDIETQSGNTFYGVEFMQNSYIFYLSSDGLCDLQVISIDGIAGVLIDDYFIFINLINHSKIKFKLNSPGDTLLYNKENMSFFIIYETGFFSFNIKTETYKVKEVEDLIYDWKIRTDTKILYSYEGSKFYEFDLCSFN